MVEYGSGVFYGTSRKRFPSSSQYTSSSISQILSLPPELDIGPSLVQSKCKIDEQLDKDVILLSEFSEIEGPIPLLSIPENIDIGIDLNDFSLQLMSTDYQNTGLFGSTFQISNDTCLLQEDSNTGYYFYVHYFTLYDVRARGFVRPMCLAYLTREPLKLRTYFKEIQKELSKVTEFLKVTNLEIFCKEMKMRIDDLNFTKRKFIQAHNHFPRDDSNSLPQIHTSSVLIADTIDLMLHPFSQQTVPNQPSEKNKKTELTERPLPTESINVSNLSYLKKPQLHNSLPTEVSRLSSQIRSEFKTESLKCSPVFRSRYEQLNFKLSPNNTLIQSSLSLDSSTSTIKSLSTDCVATKVSSLKIDNDGDIKTSVSEEVSILQHTSLDALASQLLDCQNILEASKNYLENSIATKEMKEFLEEVKSNPQSPLWIAILDLNLIQMIDEEKVAETSPTVFVAAFVYRSFQSMRQIKHICGIGYVAAITTLLWTWDHYSKPTLTLHFEALDKEIKDDPFSSLFIGNIPVLNFGCPVPSTKKKFVCFKEANCERVIRLLSVNSTKASTPESEYTDALDTVDSHDVTIGFDCLNGLINEDTSTVSSIHDIVPIASNAVKIKGLDRKLSSTPLHSTSSNGSWTSSTTKEFNLMDQIDLEGGEEDDDSVFLSEVSSFKGVLTPYLDIDRRMEQCKSYHLSAVLQQFSGVSQCIIHSILSGKCMVIAGPEYLKSVVILYAKALSTILPCKTNNILPVLKWHTGTITDYHVSCFKIIGICIPERLHVQDLMSMTTLNQVTVLNIETGHISGVAYSGSLLDKVDHLSRKHFKSDVTLQAALQSTLIKLGMKVYIFHHLRNTTTRSVHDILKGIGIPRGDWDIVQHLELLVREQINSLKI